MTLLNKCHSRKLNTHSTGASKVLAALLLMTAASAQGADATGWEQITLGGETRCADGSPFSIFMNRGTTSRVVVDFMGGGACWDSKTCQLDAVNYTKSVPDVIGQWIPEAAGIYDRTRTDNPFRNDTHVMIPYCTGDVHWGQSDMEYKTANGEAFTIHHRGGINAKAALDYTFSGAGAANKDILVTGCSAGAYASIWWTPYIRLSNPDAKIIQFSDSGAGVLTPGFRATGMPNWQIERSAPAWIPELNPDKVDIYQVKLQDMYAAVAKAHPDIRLAQYNSLNDVLQRWFYRLMGGDLYAWSDAMRQSVHTAATNSPNFHYFIAPWDAHCILPYDSFYARTTDAPQGQPFYDWLTSLISSDQPINEPCEDCIQDLP